MIHEILVSLSGLPSSLLNSDESDTVFHPSERALFRKVYQFSTLIQELTTRIANTQKQLSYPVSSATSETHDKTFQKAIQLIAPAVVTVFDNSVLKPYLEELEHIEELILARDNKLVNGSNIVPLSVVSTVMSKWKRIISYTLSVLKYLDRITMSTEMPQHNVFEIFKDPNGHQQVEALRQECINSMDRVWQQVVCSWVLYGHNEELARDFFDSTEVVFLPLNLPQSTCQLVYTTGGLMKQLNTYTADLELLRESYLRQFNALKSPIHSYQLLTLINGIRNEIILKTDSKSFSIESLHNLFASFRGIVLFGDPAFSQEFSKTLIGLMDPMSVKLFANSSFSLQQNSPVERVFADAFDQTLKTLAEDILSQYDMFSLSQKIFSLRNNTDEINRVNPEKSFFEKLTGVGVELSYNLDSHQKITIQNTAPYTEMFSFFASFRVAMELLTAMWKENNNYSITAFKTKIFMDTLWEFFQATIVDAEYNGVFQLLADAQSHGVAVNPDELSTKHRLVVEKIYDLLLLNDNQFKSLVSDLIFEIKLLYSTTTTAVNLENLIINIYSYLEDHQSSANLHTLLLKLEFINS
ncbi:conserved hypothetical protein [Geotrichum candidum]|uniref:Spindle pole body component n=1 Tax=Geotrichum candidum TaxID=1173061 RepID=A0A0J9X599_GEOCN|nr:conserved hypothetical protein [Geotrichum candidum]